MKIHHALEIDRIIWPRKRFPGNWCSEGHPQERIVIFFSGSGFPLPFGPQLCSIDIPQANKKAVYMVPKNEHTNMLQEGRLKSQAELVCALLHTVSYFLVRTTQVQWHVPAIAALGAGQGGMYSQGDTQFEASLGYIVSQTDKQKQCFSIVSYS